MIIPTIGRVVLVHVGKSDQAQPALISYVHNNRCINVGGFDKEGIPFSATNIQLLQDNDSVIAVDYYSEWMPYQKIVAAKETAS